jgi:hypothetical protein
MMRRSTRGTCLLRDGRVLASDRPACFKRMAPAEGAAASGLWTGVPDPAGDDHHGRRGVARLSPASGPSAGGLRLHRFREAVLRRYPDASSHAYPDAEPPGPAGRS